MKVFELIRWVMRASREQWMRVALLFILGVARVAAGLSFVWVSKNLIDLAIGHSTGAGGGSLLWLSVLLCVLLLAEMGCSQASNYIMRISTVKMTNTLRLKIFNTLLASSDVTGLHSADLTNRMMEDVRTITNLVCDTLPKTMVFVVQVVGSLWLLYDLSPGLAICIISITPVCVLASKLFIRKMRELTSKIRAEESASQTAMQEGLQHLLVVRTLECEPEVSRNLSGIQRVIHNLTRKRALLSLGGSSILRLGFISGYLTAFLWGIYNLHAGAITFGTMTAFLQLVGRVQQPLSGITGIVPALINTATSVERLHELQRIYLPEPVSPDYRPMKAPVGVKLSDVSFCYEAGRSVFDGFTHDFRPGSKTALMGMTGVGKSTLFKLILAVLKPEAGKVEIYNEQGESAVASKSTRCNIVYVPQGNSLLHGTIRENLRLGNPEAGEAEMLEALHTASAEFVASLPSGLDTICHELGGGLSEGQAQRIAIARALLRKGSILLLDEFNSSLDSATAETIMQRLMERHHDKTIIFISHRAEVARWCDETLELKIT